MVDELIESIQKMSRDTRRAAITLGPDESRFLGDIFYTIQELRIGMRSRLKELVETRKPHEVIEYIVRQAQILEGMCKTSLEQWVKGQGNAANWCTEQKGIGPIITANLLSNIDIERAPTYGHIWSFAGQNPGAIWIGSPTALKALEGIPDNAAFTPEQIVELARKMRGCPKWLAGRLYRIVHDIDDVPFRDLGKIDDLEYVRITLHGLKIKKKAIVLAVSRRPWNASLKTLCWKIGESFIKVQGYEDAYYGQVYAARKRYEIGRNVAEDQVETAMRIISTKKFGENTDARLWYGGYLRTEDLLDFYELPLKEREGFAKKRAMKEPNGVPMLPPGHVQGRARRATVKYFLSHLHHVLYFERFKREPPIPYPVAHLGHAHYHRPPGYRGTGTEVPEEIEAMGITKKETQEAKRLAPIDRGEADAIAAGAVVPAEDAIDEDIL